MKLNGLHILLTYQCTLECEHCFVWGGPRQDGTFTLELIETVLGQAREAQVEWIYFEGGEPFLFYALLVESVKIAAGMGFHVGIVTNAYWAISVPDAVECLKPLAAVEDLSISTDLFHCAEALGELPQNAAAAAHWLHIPTEFISINRPTVHGADGGEVMFRGRAASLLANHAPQQPWRVFDRCTNEDLRDPGRVHVDSFGNVHICQGLVIGNIFETPLPALCTTFDPSMHSICGPLLEGGPAALASEYGVLRAETFADACHLCYETRCAIRARFPRVLAPDQMYGAVS